MKLVSKRNHVYARKMRTVGSAYEALPVHAKFLIKEGLASEFKAPEKPVAKSMTAEPVKASEEEKPKREYKRRDMEAPDTKGKV